MTTVMQTDKGNRVFDIANDDHGRVLVDGVELPGCRRCCPAEKWADIMLYTEGGGDPLLNAAGDDVFIVRVLAETMSIEFIEDQPEQMSHG